MIFYSINANLLPRVNFALTIENIILRVNFALRLALFTFTKQISQSKEEPDPFTKLRFEWVSQNLGASHLR